MITPAFVLMSTSTELGMLQALATLRLDENALTGTLPSELGLIGQSLLILDVSNNYGITGTLPTEIGMLKGMTHFFGQDTLLIGNITLEVAQLAAPQGALTDFHVERTLLYGTIPEEMCSLRPEDLTFDCGGALCGCHCVCGSHLVTMSVNCLETPDLC